MPTHRVPIAVAMSGGMDSTAAAWMLKRQGHEVLGLHMRLHAGAEASWKRAQQAAAEIGVLLEEVDLTRDFEAEVVQPFVAAYKQGRTPSPCPLCNRVIKMTRLWQAASAQGCELLATGHYARIVPLADGPALLKGVDKRKDQSYFLSMLTRDMLERVVFPLGDLTKTAVRRSLQTEGISVWASNESQELCFVPGNDYRAFLAEMGITPRPGPIVDMTGRVVGRHRGIVRYTVGQRRGLGVAADRPLYVVRIDPAADTVHVGPREATMVSRTRVRSMNWLLSDVTARGSRYQVKVRSTSKPVWCTLTELSLDEVLLAYDEPQAGVAPGQAAVLYDGDRVVGAGWIVGDADGME